MKDWNWPCAGIEVDNDLSGPPAALSCARRRIQQRKEALPAPLVPSVPPLYDVPWRQNLRVPEMRGALGESSHGAETMKYRAILVDPDNANHETREIYGNSLEFIRTWAYGDTDGGIEPRPGVLASAASERAHVLVYVLTEQLVSFFPKKEVSKL
jgi:hypothetical protein